MIQKGKEEGEDTRGAGEEMMGRGGEEEKGIRNLR